MNSLVQERVNTELVWLPDQGYGYFPAFDCKTNYFEEYAALEGTEVCDQLNIARVTLVGKHIGDSPLLDFGIGAGTFINARGTDITFGYDRDGAGVWWLMDQNIYLDPYSMDSIEHISFWDALEHLEHPEVVLKKVKRHVFVSLPIFVDIDHVLQSKHYKPNEHFWYFTEWGFIKWMRLQGFICLEQSDAEVVAGREDIGAFVFERIEGGP